MAYKEGGREKGGGGGQKHCCAEGSGAVEARQDVSDRTPLLFSPVRCLLDLVHPLYKELLLQEGVSSIPLHRCYFTVVSCRVFLP